MISRRPEAQATRSCALSSIIDGLFPLFPRCFLLLQDTMKRVRVRKPSNQQLFVFSPLLTAYPVLFSVLQDSMKRVCASTCN